MGSREPQIILEGSQSNSGPVVVDAAGEIFGDVPNIAARAGVDGGRLRRRHGGVQRQVAGLFVAEEPASMNSRRSGAGDNSPTGRCARRESAIAKA